MPLHFRPVLRAKRAERGGGEEATRRQGVGAPPPLSGLQLTLAALVGALQCNLDKNTKGKMLRKIGKR